MALTSSRPSLRDSSLGGGTRARLDRGLLDARQGRLGELAVPAWLSVGLRAGLVAVAVVVAVAAIGVGIVLAMRLDDAATMLANLHAGLGGGLVVLALGLGYVPVLISWAV